MNPRNRCWHYTCIRRVKEADEALGNSGERKLGVARGLCAALSVSRAAEARASSNRIK
ncbi:protein of unknown function [Bradyrhizobium vignae]|uniref:Uncharacterized protein n=1 Tax=Bradyrhizobium vignae TaxID=1549949 RepID=A0A2U3PTF1_9BRAD|nr:protein of unknown function [Bradyrhizobium vignae]